MSDDKGRADPEYVQRMYTSANHGVSNKDDRIARLTADLAEARSILDGVRKHIGAEEETDLPMRAGRLMSHLAEARAEVERVTKHSDAYVQLSDSLTHDLEQRDRTIASLRARLDATDAVLPGLARAAEMIEQRDGGKVWDDTVRKALDGYRALAALHGETNNDPVASAKTSDGSVNQQAVTGDALSVASGASDTPNGSARVTAEAPRLQATAAGSFPTIVCLCGSTRFKEEFERVAREEGLAGRIVLTVACFGHSGDLPPEACEKGHPTKDAIDVLHFRKIEMSDEILVMNVGGYIGESTRSEIAHAQRLGKRIRYLEALQGEQDSGAKLCGKYMGDNDGTCPQLTCVRDAGHDGLCDNVDATGEQEPANE